MKIALASIRMPPQRPRAKEVATVLGESFLDISVRNTSRSSRNSIREKEKNVSLRILLAKTTEDSDAVWRTVANFAIFGLGLNTLPARCQRISSVEAFMIIWSTTIGRTVPGKAHLSGAISKG